MGRIKECFVSRFENGRILEVDFKQLEVFILAYCSQDPTLKDDLLSGVDLHRSRAADLFGKIPIDISDEERRKAKALSFQLQYGAGPTSMAKKLGLSIDVCKRFVTQFYTRYPEVKKWQDHNIKTVQRRRVPSSKHSAKGTPLGRSYLTEAGTYRSYVFYESEHGADVSFTPTVIKNYPIQGLAGTIVALGLGKIFLHLANDSYLKDKAYLINSVHDSFIFDVKEEAVDTLAIAVYNILTQLPKEFESQFGTPFNLPLEVDMKIGPNWGEMTPYKIGD